MAVSWQTESDCGDINVFDLATGTATPLGVDGGSPAFTADGNQIAFAQCKAAGITVRNLVTGATREFPLGVGPVADGLYWLSWDPTGQTLALAVGSEGDYDFRILDISKSQTVRRGEPIAPPQPDAALSSPRLLPGGLAAVVACCHGSVETTESFGTWSLMQRDQRGTWTTVMMFPDAVASYDLSPDASEVAWVDGQNRLHLSSIDGSADRVLMDGVTSVAW